MLKLPLPEISRTPKLGPFRLLIDLNSPSLLPSKGEISYEIMKNPGSIGIELTVGPFSIVPVFNWKWFRR